MSMPVPFAQAIASLLEVWSGTTTPAVTAAEDDEPLLTYRRTCRRCEVAWHVAEGAAEPPCWNCGRRR